MASGVVASLLRGRNFEALKTLRGLFALEDKELQPPTDDAERRLKRGDAMTVTATPTLRSAGASSHPFVNGERGDPNLSYNDFLTLLMAEMKNQDPTQPMDPSQMVSQLATVSEVGQAVQTNTTLASLLTATSLAQAEQLIGPTVTSADGSTSGQVASVSVTSSARSRH